MFLMWIEVIFWNILLTVCHLDIVVGFRQPYYRLITSDYIGGGELW